MGVTGGSHPLPTTYMKIWLIPPQIGMLLPLFCHQNSVVAISCNFWCFWSKLLPHQGTPSRKSCYIYVYVYVYLDFLEDNKSF